jgi:hypothetical protein
MSNENEHKESSVIPAILVFGLLACGAVILRMTGLVDGSGLVNLLSMSCLFGLAIFLGLWQTARF